MQRRAVDIQLLFVVGALLLLLSFALPVVAETNEERRARLQAELDRLTQEIAGQQVLLDETRGERQSLERDISLLNAEIEKAQLAIRRRTLTISQIADDITDREAAMRALDDKLGREKASLAQLLRRTNEIDDVTFAEMVLGSDDFSDVFSDLDAFESLKVSLSNSFVTIAETRTDIEGQKDALEREHIEEQELRQLQELEKQRVEERKGEKDTILDVTKGEEEAYQRLIREKEQSAAEIRAALFSLRDSAAIPFGDAYDYAKEAAVATGVRPALILGILTVESNLGENVGTGTWLNDMHPTRDRPVFEQITVALGLDPDSLPVSRKPWYGWGGAMGPAQFIPSTWVCYGGFINTRTGDCGNSRRSLTWSDFWQGPWEYRASTDRLRRMTGSQSPSNPWDPRTAIFAASTLMMDNGADDGTPFTERRAALRYFAGWTNANDPDYAFYGDEVMKHAATIQRQIDILEQ